MGVTIKKAKYYFGKVSGCEPINFLPIIEPSALKHFYNLKEISCLEIGVAGITNREAFDDDKASITKVTSLMETFGAPSIEVKLSARYDHNTRLHLGAVQNFFKSLLRKSDEGNVELNKMRVRGRKNSDAALEFIDLLKQRVKYEEKINFEKRESIPYNKIEAALVNAWVAKEAIIRTIFEAQS